MANETLTLRAIYRYPVKGLSPEPLQRTTLAPGETVPGDRLYAIENGPSGFNPAVPKHLPKMRFLMLMRNERLATLRTRYDDASHTLAVEHDGREAARGDLSTPASPSRRGWRGSAADRPARRCSSRDRPPRRG